MTPTYAAVHQRLRKVRGPASEQTCSCGEPAADWAYQPGGEELLSPEGRPYSSNLMADYRAMCVRCHHKLDHGRLFPARSANGQKLGGWVREQIRHGRIETQRAGGTATGKLRRRCSCGLTTSPGPLSNHQAATGHSGWETVA